MRVAEMTFEGVSPYSQSRVFRSEKKSNERPDEYDERCWRERMHADKSGNVYIPAMAIKKSLESAAQFLGKKIPGKGNSTYGKRFKSGILMMDMEIPLGLKVDEVPGEQFHMDAQGGKTSAGKSTRVKRRMPMISEWGGTCRVAVVDDAITPEVFAETAKAAGTLIGIGRWRPEMGGMNGRFAVTDITWNEDE